MIDLPLVSADPLGVLTTTRAVVQAAQAVAIDPDRVGIIADELAATMAAPPAWDDDRHFRDGTATWRTAGWVLVLDALNFCFWSEETDPNRRWKVEVDGRIHDGYWALAAALRRAVTEGYPLWDATYLATIPADDVARILRPAEDPAASATPIPLFPARVANLRELGRGLRDRFSDGPAPAPAALIAAGRGSAVRLVELVTQTFPSFDDVATYAGAPVHLYKRAQILVADLHGALAGAGLGAFTDLEQLTAFADYKVPQVLRRLGILHYAPELAARIDTRLLIPAASAEEIEIRAATIWGCELLRQTIAARGQPRRAFEIDWALWSAGQSLPPDTHPYHRTPTIFY